MERYWARRASPSAGSHFTLTSIEPLRSVTMAKIFPLGALNTGTPASNGNVSVAPAIERHRAVRESPVMTAAPCRRAGSEPRWRRSPLGQVLLRLFVGGGRRVRVRSVHEVHHTR